LKQFLLNTEPDKDGMVQLEGNDYHYLVRVRRLAVGEFFQAILPNGKETLVKIISVNSKILTGRCEPSTNLLKPNSSSAAPQLILFQALPKADKFDLIVRQAAEGGIAEIVPFVSEFSTGSAETGELKFSRWERIIKEARQQSGSKTATVLHRPMLMNKLMEHWQTIKNTDTLGLLFHHISLDRELVAGGLEKESLHGYLSSNPKVVVFAIGPEGGFSNTEVSTFLENGFKTLTIGDTILRTETAALYCAAAVKIILLERHSWELQRQ